MASSSSSSDIYDVVIVGSGMVGSALAALLGSNPLTASMRVAVLDQKPQSGQWKPAPYPELRVSTITPASIAILERAGAWHLIAPHAAEFANMQVWDTPGPGFIRWRAQDVGRSNMGAVAENSLMQACLIDTVQRNCPGTEFIWPAALAGLRLPSYSRTAAAATAAGRDGSSSSSGASSSEASDDLAEVALTDGRRLRARLVVAADGRASQVRELAGLRTFGWDYQQRGLVATVTTAEPNVTAWQRFLPTGPLALLPVRDGFSNIVWSVPHDMAKRLEATGPQEFAVLVNQALLEGAPRAQSSPLPLPLPLGDRFEEPPRVTAWVGMSPKSFPLILKTAGRYVRPRLALVGDAAHAVHPMAGQGVNLGYGDVGVLAEALARARECGQDPGSAVILEDLYERPRQSNNLAMIAAMDGLKRVFALQAGPLGALRSLGLGLFNSVGPVKNGVMKYAMGL